MPLVLPSQLAALRDAAADSRGELRRTRGPRGAGYSSDASPQLHTPKSACALQREGLLAEREEGLQAVYVITDAGRQVVEANARVRAKLKSFIADPSVRIAPRVSA